NFFFFLCFFFFFLNWFYVFFFFFFFQAEDGIRKSSVTGVQTCALPICWWRTGCPAPGGAAKLRSGRGSRAGKASTTWTWMAGRRVTTKKAEPQYESVRSASATMFST